MDPDAVGAALTPAALAPPIAHRLGLSVESVTSALILLADGAQPAFVARYRPERIGGLTIRDLERIQAAAAHAVAFEFKRQEVLGELKRRKLTTDPFLDHLRSARDLVDLDDLRALFKRRRRGPANKARGQGLLPVAEALWKFGSTHAIWDQVSRADHEGAATPIPPPGEEPSDRSGPPPSSSAESSATPATPAAPVEGAGEDPAQQEPPSEPLDRTSPAAAAPGAEAGEAEAASAGAAGDATSEAAPATEVAEGASEGAGDGTPDDAAPEVQAAAKPAVVLADPKDVVASIGPDDIGDFATELSGARAICADEMTDLPGLRRALRDLLLADARWVCSRAPGKGEKSGKYEKYANFNQPVASVASPAVLAIHRGERDGMLRVDLEIDDAPVLEKIVAELGIDAERPAGAELRKAAQEAWQHGLGKAVRTGVRKLLKRKADLDAISEYSTALRPLMLAPAFGAKPVLAIDPGLQNGCRLAMLDASGRLLADDTVFPLTPKLQVPQAKARISELCQAHGARAIVVTTGTSGRDVERMCRELVRETEELRGVVVASLDSDAASLHASTRAAKDEFKDGDAGLRRAVSAGRTVQDPLRQLVKVDPRKLGLGQHQHEVDQEELRTALEQVMVSCVSEVCVEVNRAPADLLPWVAGMSHALSKALAGFRETHGPVRSRTALLEVPGFAGKAFEQAAGFLRIEGGDNELDATMIHPERYGQVTEMARDLGVTITDLMGDGELLDKLEPDKYLGRPGISGEPLGRQTFDFIVGQLRQPGQDPRPPFCTVEFSPDLKEFEDLSVGMELEGLVTHLAPFGAFVDVGIAQEGLVHVSELSHGFISSPSEAVYCGQKVRGRVIEISADRKRFSLSLKALLPRPERSGKPDAKGKRRKAKGRGDAAGSGPRRGGGGPRGRDGNKGKRPAKERTLGFRLDLSAVVEQLEKG